MPSQSSPAQLAAALAALPANAHAINFYSAHAHCCPDPRLDDDSATARLARMTDHLRVTVDSSLVVVGEAAGWRGARQSGVAFTAPAHVRDGGMHEASATVVQRALTGHQLATPARLLNAYPLHPHRPGVPRSNRTPTSAELTSAQPLLRGAIGSRHVIAVGRNAARSWTDASQTAVSPIGRSGPSATAVAIRHPSFGGAAIFRVELSAALAHFGLLPSST